MKPNPFDPVALAGRLQSMASGAEGLQVVFPGVTDNAPGFQVTLTERLTQWLTDLRLLRRVPLSYLVPDPKLLPPESIRFFHVDPTWTDRLIDGAMSAGNLGTLDMTFTMATLTHLRAALDGLLGIDQSGTMTGMLIRSELVARWPDLIVQGTDKGPGPVPLLRQDLLSKSIMIVLFAGVPTQVTVREPHVGLRFGVEAIDPHKTAGPYQVPARNPATGVFSASEVKIDLSTGRVLDVNGMLGKLPAGAGGTPRASRDVALNLQRPPYVQYFVGTVDPDKGSQLPFESGGGFGALKLRGGREVKLDKVLTGLHRLPGGGK